MKIAIVYLFVFCSSFFPAYLGYQSDHAGVGYIFTIGFALSCYVPFLKDYNKQGWIGLIAIASFGYLIESMGILTCFPYGCFSYSEQLGPKLFGIVPVMLAFTRPPLVLGVWSYAKNLFGHGWKLWLSGGISLMMVDLILDPIAVMIGLWSYPGGGFWFGVPLSNFAGRIFSGTISMILLDKIVRNIYNKNTYPHGLGMTLMFFVGYAIWKAIILIY